ncbi:5-formyltetrahydrofolate cyclo-ligase [Fuscibacter oryzae]|uniref:5-formyltetrahydrofolate cyclo-ligase n=1 Tax=Fuscibacter oryzae TaxID=2803939 RepID=A0A8J7MVD2_9RHOB|nr:5-formyltetrahydrofolate cyclo-ligase [Fuscibacter oryzae]MBL4928204.1 5-formyltetrahydrofolate cyclo-ligase [Fuscibacter oryzae]
MTGAGQRPPSSPVCSLAEVEGHDMQQELEVARWRRAERERLRADRMAMAVAARQDWAAALMRHLSAGLSGWLGDPKGRVISGYWPIKGEADLRPWLTELHAAGAIIALPVVVTKASPLVFRHWYPGMVMERGDWNIPVPPASAKVLHPDLSLAPLVGWDRANYRLGYGGGYFDRTLAAASPRPFVVGVGLQSAELATVFPQWHDIPMSVIVTDEGVQSNSLSRSGAPR